MENISENEINEFLNNLGTAQRDGQAWGFLGKGPNANQNVAALGRNAINSIGELGGRAIYHANRLLEQKRSEIERNFALVLAKNAGRLMKSFDGQDDRLIRGTISGEGSDCCLWWTLSPYIFDELKSKVGEEDAVKQILEWAKTGRPIDRIKDKEINLSGLDIYNYAWHGRCTFTLGQNSNDLSHQFARKEAQRLVREVFST